MVLVLWYSDFGFYLRHEPKRIYEKNPKTFREQKKLISNPNLILNKYL